MTPLDLTQAPPRSPRLQLRGLCMLPRMIDIARAHLPGGKVGDYQIGQGFSGMVLHKLRLDVPTFLRHVAEAQDDTEVAVRVCGERPDSDFAGLSAMLPRATVADVPPELREVFQKYYGGDLPPTQNLFDLLEADDAGRLPTRSGNA